MDEAEERKTRGAVDRAEFMRDIYASNDTETSSFTILLVILVIIFVAAFLF